MQNTITLEAVRLFLKPYAGYFRRAQARELAARYVWGLILEGERKSAEAMAPRVQASGRGLQRLLNEVRWDHTGALAQYRRQQVPDLGDPDSVLLLDETVFPKRGGHSVCVGRLHSARLDRQVSCQMAVDATVVSRGHGWPYAMELYVPSFWDRRRAPHWRERRAQAHMPPQARHWERWRMALDLIDAAPSVGVVSTGADFGVEDRFVAALAQGGQRFLLEIPPETLVFGSAPVLQPPRTGHRARGRPRKHGPLLEAAIPPVKASSLVVTPENLSSGPVVTPVWPAAGYRDGILQPQALLITDPCPDRAGDPRFFLSNLPREGLPEACARVALALAQARKVKARMINDLGLLHYEGRSWIGWHRHVLLVCLAYACGRECEGQGSL